MNAKPRLSPERSAQITDLVSILTHPGPGGAVILGGAGIGKTSLVETALSRTLAKVGEHTLVLRLHCSPTLASVPYGALSPYLSKLEKIEDPVQVLRELNSAFAGSQDGLTTPIVVVEDAQFMDPESSFVLALLVENAAVKLVAIGAGRIDGESTLFSLTDSGLLATLAVEPFDSSGVRFLAQELTGGELTESAVRTIQAMTGGNPSFVKIFVQACLDQGTLVQEVGSTVAEEGPGRYWVLARPAPEPDEGLIETVREMHTTLPPGHQRTLEILALGGPQHSALLLACGGGDYRHLLESGILSSGRDGQIRIGAEIHAIVLRHIVAPGRSAELHAQWTERRKRLGIGLTPLQVLWSLEVAHEVSTDEVMAAVETAGTQLDYLLAWKLCVIAGLGSISEAGLLLEARTLLGLGRTYSARAMLLRVMEKTSDQTVLQRAFNMLFLALVRMGADRNELTTLESVWNTRAQEIGKQGTSSAAAYERAVGLINLWRAVQDYAGGAGPLEEAERLLSDRLLSREGRCFALIMLSDLHSIAGRTETALGLAREAMSELDREPHPTADHLLHLLFRIGWNLVFSGQYAEAEEFIAARRGADVRLHMHRHGTFSLIEGICQLLQGQTLRAKHTFFEAIAELRLRDPLQLLSMCQDLQRIVVHRSTMSVVQNVGNMSSAVHDHDANEPFYPVRMPFYHGLLSRAVAASVHEMEGKMVEYYPLLEREVLAMAPDRVLGDEQEKQRLNGRLLLLAQKMEGQRATFLARLADLSLATESASSETLAREAIDADEYQIAAQSIAQAAMLYSSLGDARRCGSLLRELMELLRERQITPDHYVSRALAMAELTSREEEIVELARTGKNNAEIARILTVSQRTVEGHLYRVFSKLGISERSELARLRLYAGNPGR